MRSWRLEFDIDDLMMYSEKVGLEVRSWGGFDIDDDIFGKVEGFGLGLS
jgi:hypothetical protein